MPSFGNGTPLFRSPIFLNLTLLILWICLLILQSGVLMDRAPCDFVVDLDSTIEGGASPDPISTDKLGKTFFNNVSDDQAENGLSMIGNVKDDLVAEKKNVKDKRKSTSAKKPPRPPRGLSLDAADQKLIKEIAQIAVIKRARIERIKALKKMKAAKTSSTSSSSAGNVLAFLFTLLFFLVLCFQGMSSGSSAHDSSLPSGSRSNSFIIQPYYSDISAKSAGSPNLVDPRDGLT